MTPFPLSIADERHFPYEWAMRQRHDVVEPNGAGPGPFTPPTSYAPVSLAERDKQNQMVSNYLSWVIFTRAGWEQAHLLLCRQRLRSCPTFITHSTQATCCLPVSPDTTDRLNSCAYPVHLRHHLFPDQCAFGALRMRTESIQAPAGFQLQARNRRVSRIPPKKANLQLSRLLLK